MLMRPMTMTADFNAFAEMSLKPDLTCRERAMVIDYLFYASRAAMAEMEDSAWLCLHVRTGREKIVENLLREAGVEALLPCYGPQIVVRRGRKFEVPGGPLLAGYVLVRCAWDRRAFIALEAIEHVYGLIGGALKPMRISDTNVISFMELAGRKKQEDEAKAANAPVFANGEWVLVISGPFARFQGEIVQVKKREAKVLLKTLGHENEIWMPLATLAKL